MKLLVSAFVAVADVYSFIDMSKWNLCLLTGNPQVDTGLMSGDNLLVLVNGIKRLMDSSIPNNSVVILFESVCNILDKISNYSFLDCEPVGIAWKIKRVDTEAIEKAISIAPDNATIGANVVPLKDRLVGVDLQTIKAFAGSIAFGKKLKLNHTTGPLYDLMSLKGIVSSDPYFQSLRHAWDMVVKDKVLPDMAAAQNRILYQDLMFLLENADLKSRTEKFDPEVFPFKINH